MYYKSIRVHTMHLFVFSICIVRYECENRIVNYGLMTEL
jgi:hypothetical protein